MTISSASSVLSRYFVELSAKKSQAIDTGIGFSIPAPVSAIAPEKSTSASPPSSTSVQISSDADSVSELAAEGIAVFTINSPQFLPNGLLSGFSGNSIRGDESGSVSKSDFEKLIAQFGGNGEQADQLFKTFDSNGDGSISYNEVLSGLGILAADSNSPFAQSLGSLMDIHGNHDGIVSEPEFVSFETAFLNAETVPNDDATTKNGSTDKQTPPST